MSWKAKLIVFTICIYFTSASYTMIVPFLPLYLLELGANQNNIEFWTAVIFSVSFFVGGVMAPLWGKLADKKGQKSMSVRSSAMLCIAYLCGGIVVSPLQLLGMRVLQGFANGYLPSVLSRVSSFSPTDKLGSSLGFIQSSQLVGTVSGPLIGGVLAHLFGIRSSFFIAGTFLLIVFLVTAFVPGEEIAKNNEKQEKSSIVNDFKFTVKDKNLRELLSLFFLFSLVMLAIQPILSLYVGELIESREDMAFYAGIACSLPSFVGAFTAPFWGSFGQRRGFYLSMSCAFFGAAFFLFIQGFAQSITYLFVTGAGMGLFIVGIVPSINAALSLATTPQFRGRGFGMMTMAGQFGCMLGPLLSGAVVHTFSLNVQFHISGAFLFLMSFYTFKRHIHLKRIRRNKFKNQG
ncbi:MFS transporter [Succinatimonas hippei]|uniref:MFS transporter n=1 Tax=Succinatimonas hippei TaxID=626938 RepID=UPI0023F8D931|nr:MFS transporter [Succinatimonas hippei]